MLLMAKTFTEISDWIVERIAQWIVANQES